MGPARCFLFAAGLAVAATPAWPQSLHLQMRASEILGREVTTPAGERLAIRDLVIDPVSGKVEFFALGHPEERDVEKLRLYPVQTLRSVAGGGLVLIPRDEALPASAGASGRAP
jgi:sporulation protein YlmC with PRC-barrel domain